MKDLFYKPLLTERGLLSNNLLVMGKFRLKLESNPTTLEYRSDPLPTELSYVTLLVFKTYSWQLMKLCDGYPVEIFQIKWVRIKSLDSSVGRASERYSEVIGLDSHLRRNFSTTKRLLYNIPHSLSNCLKSFKFIYMFQVLWWTFKMNFDTI